MDQWEYKIITGGDEGTLVEWLNQAGNEGWEAVGVSTTVTSDDEIYQSDVLLKRKKPTLLEQIGILQARYDALEDPDGADNAEAWELYNEITRLRGQLGETGT